MLGFRACNFQHVSLASGRTVFSSCGADPSKAKKRLSAPMRRGASSQRCLWWIPTQKDAKTQFLVPWHPAVATTKKKK
jgi:hypothetical protein